MFGRRRPHVGGLVRARTVRTVDGHHCRPPCAVLARSVLSPRAISPRLLPLACSRRMRSTTSGDTPAFRPERLAVCACGVAAAFVRRGSARVRRLGSSGRTTRSPRWRSRERRVGRVLQRSLYEGRTLNEVAEHLGHGDPGFTARFYAHVMRDAARRRITISEAIGNGRATARRRPLVDPSGAEPGTSARDSREKSLEIERADARIRTADPFITS